MPTARPDKRQIIALGGGGFSMEPRNLRLDRYLLAQSKKKRPKICFVPTASGDSENYVRRFYKAYRTLDCEPSDLCLFRRDERDPSAHLLAQDVIFVGGGSTFNLLAIWRAHGIDQAMRKAWRAGIVLSGVSAGMLCWFEACITDSFGPIAPLDDGLALLPGTGVPHYNGQNNRREILHNAIANGFPAALAAEDGAAIHFRGRKLLRCVASRPEARAYRVAKTRGKVTETKLPITLLNADGTLPE